MRLRLATRDDVAAILAISNRAAASGYANFATEPEPLDEWRASFDRGAERYPWWVAEEAGAVVGFAKAGPHKSRGAYAHTAEVSVYVEPGAHRRGVGAALYERLLATLRAQGYRTLIAGIAAPNPASEGLHARAGFARVGTFPRVGFKHGQFRDVSYWALILDPSDAPPAPLRTVREAVEGLGWT